MVPLLAVLNCAALLRNSPAPRSACLRCSVAAPPATTAEAAPPSLYPAWPLALSEKPELQDVIDAFEETSTAVPLRAAFEEGDGWRVWSDGGFAIQKFLAAKAMSRASYPAILACLRGMMVQSQAKYPDLYAVLKFVPKKNGLNPLLAQIDEGADASAVALDGLRPREARRRIEDAQRTLEQSWLLLHAYLTLPSSKHREDLLWAARTVVEKVKSDQRTRAIELLALGVFDRRASLYELVGGGDAPWSATPLRVGFERNFGVDAWHPKPTNSRMVWQRSRMVYPFLEVAHRAWLRASGHEEQDEEDEAAIADILDRIARAGPEEKVLNSLLYWLLDLCYKVMGKGESIPAWAPEPYLLRRDGVEGRMVEELEGLGHLLQLLGQCAERSEEGLCIVSYDGEDEEGVSFGRHAARGDQLLLEVKEVVATSTLLASIRDSCADACPTVLNDYLMALRSPSLTLERIEELELESIASLLDVDTELVIEREETVRAAMSEWRNPELLFRYLDANRNDAKMYPLIKRWMRAIFGLSDETLRMIRRESAENIRHLVQIPQDVLLRWYSEACPGTSKCKTLFMLGEDAGSCLRVISNEGNKFNRALMGYVLQSHVRALVVVDTAGRVMVRSLIRLLLRSDTLTPVIFCDPMFFTLGYSRELQRELLVQARMLEEHMGIPVLHAGSLLPAMPAEADAVADDPTLGAYTRRVTELDYDIEWVDLLEMDGVAPYTYSEELPYDELLQQHTPGVLSRTPGAEEREARRLVIAALPREDSPTAARYVREREGETAWTMHIKEGDLMPELPAQVRAQMEQKEHTPFTFDPNARSADRCSIDQPLPVLDHAVTLDELPAGYVPPQLDE